MGRGLGRLQREILATLDDAKREVVYYRGSARQRPVYNQVCGWLMAERNEPGWVSGPDGPVLLPDDVYDLRASMRYLAQKHGALEGLFSAEHDFVTPSFQASFSRAVRALVRRGLLEAGWGRQRRFVTVTDAGRALSVKDRNITLREGA
jgi:hypothetical protein